MAPLNVLISGAGIAGPVVAYWLLEADPDTRITLVERSRDLRTAGQSIDIRQAAIDVVRRMGVLDAIRAKTTTETGIRFVDAQGKAVGTLLASGDEKQQSFTSEYEILRGDLVQILYDTVKDRITTVFGESVDQYTEDDATGKVHVTFGKGRPDETYDLVIAADGQSSRIRQIALKEQDPREHYRSFCNYCAYFTMKTEDLPAHADPARNGQLALWYNSTLGRGLFLRPDPQQGLCRANVVRQLLPSDVGTNERYRGALAPGQSKEAIQKVLREDFADAGWAAEQVLAAMSGAEDFYASETAQVQCPTLAVGRVALVGDAGYGPTPLTGMGTSLALIGAFILAGEVSACQTAQDIPQALQRYDDIMLPYSRKVQNIPVSLPQYANPQSAWGLTIVRGVQRVVLGSGVVGVISKLSGLTAFGKKEFQLPTYAAFGESEGSRKGSAA